MTTSSESDSRIAAAGAQVRDAAAQAREVAGQAYDTTVEKVGDIYSSAKETAGDLLSVAREKAGDAYSSARVHAASASKATVEGVGANPVAALIGGLAAGAVAAALLPKSDREAALLAPLGAKLGDMAKLAANAAKEAGLSALDEHGISKASARGQVDKLFDTARDTLRSAGGAAADAVRKPD